VILTRSFATAAHITLLEIVLLQAGDLHESAKQSPWLISMDSNHDPFAEHRRWDIFVGQSENLRLRPNLFYLDLGSGVGLGLVLAGCLCCC
jgi:hypothetical protein